MKISIVLKLVSRNVDR